MANTLKITIRNHIFIGEKVKAVTITDAQTQTDVNGNYSITGLDNNQPYYILCFADIYGKRWKPNTTYNVNDIIRPYSLFKNESVYRENGHYYKVIVAGTSQSSIRKIEDWPVNGSPMYLGEPLTWEDQGEISAQWEAQTTYNVNDIVRPSNSNGNGRTYTCSIAGVSDIGNEPDWSTALNSGDTLFDNDITWTCQGEFAPKWQASNFYNVNDNIRPIDDNSGFDSEGHIYKCIIDGTSGTTEPTWVFDGTINEEYGNLLTVQDMGLVDKPRAIGPVATTNNTISGTVTKDGNPLINRNIFYTKASDVTSVTTTNNNAVTLTVPNNTDNYFVLGFYEIPIDTWSPNTTYNVGTKIRPNADNGFWYECIKSGTSGDTEPTWVTGGNVLVDNKDVCWVSRCEIQRPIGAGPFEIS